MNDIDLLRRYAHERSDDAFRLLFERHHKLVYSTCLRDIGDSDFAEDAALAVFVILSRKARQLCRYRSIAGWLYLTARLASRDVVKQQIRRREREEPLAGADIPPVGSDRQWRAIEAALHDAIDALPAGDRETILLRFFDGMSVKEVAAALAVSEEAAKKRVARSLKRLRLRLAGATVVVGEVVLVSLLDGHAANASIASFGASLNLISSGSLPIPVDHITQGALRRMQITQLKLAAACLSAIVIAGFTVNTVVAHAYSKHIATVKPVQVQAASSGTPLDTLRGVRENYQSLKSYSATIISQDSSGLYPGRFTQQIVWRSPAAFSLTVASTGAGTNAVDNWYGMNDAVRELGTRYPSVQPRIRPNSMPGWEVTGSFVVSWLERTLNGDIFERFPPEYPSGAKFEFAWGSRSTWHKHVVKEIVATLTIPSNSSMGRGGTQAMSLFIDPSVKTLIGLEVPMGGKIGYTEYADQQFNPTVPNDVGVAPTR